MTLYRIVETVWEVDAVRWPEGHERFLGYYRDRRYASRRWAERDARRLRAAHPDHRFYVEETR
jgi:hypothetical protein